MTRRLGALVIAAAAVVGAVALTAADEVELAPESFSSGRAEANRAVTLSALDDAVGSDSYSRAEENRAAALAEIDRDRLAETSYDRAERNRFTALAASGEGR